MRRQLGQPCQVMSMSRCLMVRDSGGSNNAKDFLTDHKFFN